jgi:hypothetical protein
MQLLRIRCFINRLKKKKKKKNKKRRGPTPSGPGTCFILVSIHVAIYAAHAEVGVQGGVYAFSGS